MRLANSTSRLESLGGIFARCYAHRDCSIGDSRATSISILPSLRPKTRKSLMLEVCFLQNRCATMND